MARKSSHWHATKCVRQRNSAVKDRSLVTAVRRPTPPPGPSATTAAPTPSAGNNIRAGRARDGVFVGNRLEFEFSRQHYGNTSATENLKDIYIYRYASKFENKKSHPSEKHSIGAGGAERGGKRKLVLSSTNGNVAIYTYVVVDDRS